MIPYYGDSSYGWFDNYVGDAGRAQKRYASLKLFIGLTLATLTIW
jgi:hypothetical protein